MLSGQRWVVGEDPNDVQNESDVGITKPLLQGSGIPKRTPFRRMWFLGSIVAAPYILVGMDLGFSSITLPQMDVNIDEASYFGSSSTFGSMFGGLASGFIMDKYGRRPSLILSIIPCIIGWLLLGTSSNINVIYLARFLEGMIGGCTHIGQVYAAESIVVNHNHLRGSFNVWYSIAISVGAILDTVLGRLLSYQTIALVAAAMATISLTGICIFIPESPNWLCQQGLIHRARLSEKQLSIHQPILEDFQHTQPSIKFNKRLTWQSFKTGLQKLKRKDIHKPLILLNVWFILVIFSGSASVAAYQVNILNDYPVIIQGFETNENNNLLSSYDMSIVSAILGLIAVILTSILVIKTGIKALYRFSAIGMAVGMTLLAVSLGIREDYQRTQFWHSVHTTSVIMIAFFDTLGVSIIPSSVVGELFPHDSKGFACLAPVFSCGILGIVIKLHLYFYTFLGFLLYFVYAFIALLSVVFVEIFVPETVGKTQAEIEKYFTKA